MQKRKQGPEFIEGFSLFVLKLERQIFLLLKHFCAKRKMNTHMFLLQVDFHICFEQVYCYKSHEHLQLLLCSNQLQKHLNPTVNSYFFQSTYFHILFICITLPSTSFFYFNFSIGIGFAYLSTPAKVKADSSATRLRLFYLNALLLL